MLKQLAITIGFVLSVTGCIAEMDTTGDLEQAAIITSPEDIVAPCPPDMPPSYCDPEGGGGSGTGGGGGGGGGGSGGGGGGGNCTPGTEGCSGPVNCGPGRRYNWTLHMCVVTNHMQSCDWGYNPWAPFGVCRIDVDGGCACNPPPCSVFDPCPPPPFAP